MTSVREALAAKALAFTTESTPLSPLCVERSASPELLPSPVLAREIATGEPVTLLIDQMISAGDPGILAGEDGTMKSTLALHLCGAIAGGYRAFGHFQAKQGAVLVISEEDSAPVVRNRLEAICRGHGWNADAVLGNVHVLAMAEVRLTSHTWHVQLLRYIEERQIALVVIDPWAEVGTGEENSNSEGRVLVQTVRSFTKPTGASVLIVHHFGKPAEGKRPRDRIRGNSAVPSASRFTYTVEHDDAARTITLTCLKFSRGTKLAPFVVRYHIEADSRNRTVWTRARFDYATVAEATLDKAAEFVLEQLGAGERMNTTALKDAAKGTGVSAADISRALKTLDMLKRIDFEEGPKGAKMWGLSGCRENSGNHGNQLIQLAGQPLSLPGNQSEDGFWLPSPYRGKQLEPTDTPDGATTSTEPSEFLESLKAGDIAGGEEKSPSKTPEFCQSLKAGEHAGSDDKSAGKSAPELSEPLKCAILGSPDAQEYPCGDCGSYSFPRPGMLCIGCQNRRKRPDAA